MKKYIDLVRKVQRDGSLRHEERTDTDILSTFGVFVEIDLAEGFPLLTTKQMAFKSLCIELEWFLKGKTDLQWLLERGCHVWTGDAFKAYGSDYEKHLGYEPGQLTIPEFSQGVKCTHPLEENADFPWFIGGCDLGPIYGAQWRGTYSEDAPDQLLDVVKQLKVNPTSRRHLVVAWNPSLLDEMVLPPCHYAFQFYVRWVENVKYLDLMWIQRSADIALGIPFNFASYALLLHLVAQEIGASVGFLKSCIGDAHIYASHLDTLEKQVTLPPYPLPRIDVSQTSLWDFDATKVRLEGYKAHDRLYFKLYN